MKGKDCIRHLGREYKLLVVGVIKQTEEVTSGQIQEDGSGGGGNVRGEEMEGASLDGGMRQRDEGFGVIQGVYKRRCLQVEWDSR